VIWSEKVKHRTVSPQMVEKVLMRLLNINGVSLNHNKQQELYKTSSPNSECLFAF